MKCVKDKRTKEIARISDKSAETLVRYGNHEYCPKYEWKMNVRDKDV